MQDLWRHLVATATIADTLQDLRGSPLCGDRIQFLPLFLFFEWVTPESCSSRGHTWVVGVGQEKLAFTQFPFAVFLKVLFRKCVEKQVCKSAFVTIWTLQLQFLPNNVYDRVGFIKWIPPLNHTCFYWLNYSSVWCHKAQTQKPHTHFFLSNWNKIHMKLVKQVLRLIFQYENVKH